MRAEEFLPRFEPCLPKLAKVPPAGLVRFILGRSLALAQAEKDAS